MSRKSIFISVILVLVVVILLLLVLPAMASSSGQQPNPPERTRPDQYSYHGKEDIYFRSPLTPPTVGSISIDTPVEQWSRMTFETYTDIGADWDITIGNGDFSNLFNLTNNGGIDDIQPRLNRGCTQVAFASYQGTNYEIYTINVDASHLTRLTLDGTDDVLPVWSPDGTRIAFQSYRDGNAEVYVMNADGSGPINLTNSSDYDGEPSWSPDGSKIAFTSRRTGGYRIYVMNADGSNPVMLSQQAYSETPVWSPDGSQIGYDADSDNDLWQELWSMNANGSLQTLRADPGNNHTYWTSGWSPDGLWLLYTEVSMINYYGNWYWDYASLKKISNDGQSYVINSGRGVDWFLDWTTSDSLPPITGMNTLYSTLPYQFTVSWWGQDNWAGISSFEVQVRDGQFGTWTDWQAWTPDTSAIFTGLGGHDYFFRTRGRDNASNIQPWPADYQTHAMVEIAPPISKINQIEPLIRGNQVTLTWMGSDVGGSGIAFYDIQFMDSATGQWENWLMETPLISEVFSGEPGHTYYFRSRATDMATNVETWPDGNGDTTTTFFSWLTAGTAHDNTGSPVSDMDLSIDPEALVINPSDRDGKYSAYLGSNPPVKTITWLNAKYGELPATDFGTQDANVDVYLPPSDNIVKDFGFESGNLPGDWQAGGDFTPVLTTTSYHSGDYAALLGTPPTMSSMGFIDNMTIGDADPLFIDRLGGVHIASTTTTNWEAGVSYAHRLPDGVWQTPEFVYDPPDSELKVDLVVDDDLNVHMLIQMYNGILYTMRDPAGNWTAPQQILSSYDLIGMKIDHLSTIHALFTNGTTQSYARYEIGGEWEIKNVPGMEYPLETAFSTGPLGEFHLAWSGGDQSILHYMVHLPDGSWTSPVTFTRPAYTNYLDMVLDSAGQPHIIWTAHYQTTQLMYTTRNLDGSWVSPRDISSGYSSYIPKLLIDRHDTLYAIWITDVPTNQVYFSQKSMQDDWTQPINISQISLTSYNVQAAVATNGDIFVAWVDYTNHWDMYYVRMQAGIWGPPVLLASAQFQGFSPKVAADDLDGAFIGWSVNYPNIQFRYINTQPLPMSGDAWLSQSLTIPVSMTHPTLSFLASLYGVSDVSGSEFSVRVSTDAADSIIYSSTTPSTWEHDWFDVTSWSGQEITLTFQLTENAGFPPASALLDEVTIGEAHSDVWLDLSGGTLIAHPGDRFDYQLQYGNHGGVIASNSVITMTLPLGLSLVDASFPPQVIGNQLVWQLGDLPASSDNAVIYVTVEVDASAPMLQTVQTSVEIATSSHELEKLNNTSQSATYLAYLQILPIIRR